MAFRFRRRRKRVVAVKLRVVYMCQQEFNASDTVKKEIHHFSIHDSRRCLGRTRVGHTKGMQENRVSHTHCIDSSAITPQKPEPPALKSDCKLPRAAKSRGDRMAGPKNRKYDKQKGDDKLQGRGTDAAQITICDLSQNGLIATTQTSFKEGQIAEVRSEQVAGGTRAHPSRSTT